MNGKDGALATRVATAAVMAATAMPGSLARMPPKFSHSTAWTNRPAIKLGTLGRASERTIPRLSRDGPGQRRRLCRGRMVAGPGWRGGHSRRTRGRSAHLPADDRTVGRQVHRQPDEASRPRYIAASSAKVLTYERGDFVQWGGNLWHANETTTEKPIEGAKAWSLAARRGRDGKTPGGIYRMTPKPRLGRAIVNAQATVVARALDGGYCEFRSGEQPADADEPVPDDSLLGRCKFAEVLFSEAKDGVIVANKAQRAQAIRTGDPTWILMRHE